MVRARLAAAGFAELAYDVLDEDTLPAVGAARYDGPPAPSPPGGSSPSGAEECLHCAMN